MTFSPYGNTNSLGIPTNTMEVIGGGKYGDEQDLADQDEANVQEDLEREEETIQEEFDKDELENRFNVSETIDARSGWPVHIINPERTLNNYGIHSATTPPKTLFGIRWDQSISNVNRDKLPFGVTYDSDLGLYVHKDINPLSKEFGTEKYYHTFEEVPLVGDRYLANLKNNWGDIWNWIGEQEWGPGFQQHVETTGVNIGEWTGDLIEEINDNPHLHPEAFAVLKVLEGIDTFFTYGGNVASTYFPINSHASKFTLELAVDLLSGGITKGKNLKNLDNIADWSRYNRWALQGVDGSVFTTSGITFSENISAGTFFALSNSADAVGDIKSWHKRSGSKGIDKAGNKVKTQNQRFFGNNVNIEKLFGGDKFTELKAYLDAADAHRIRTKVKLEGAPGGLSKQKKIYMNGFTNPTPNPVDGKVYPWILDNNGRKWILQRQPTTSTRKLLGQGIIKDTDKSFYKLMPVDVIEDQIVKNSLIKTGYSKEARQLVAKADEIRAFMQNTALKHPGEYYNGLMSLGSFPYIEHKVAKRQFWFWKQKQLDPEFGKWASINRNDHENLRMLFSQPYKKLKDTVEKNFKKGSWINNNKARGGINNYLVIDIEDPMSLAKVQNKEGMMVPIPIHERTNPGNIVIRRASDGAEIGQIGGYYSVFYRPGFEDVFKKYGSQFSNKKLNGVNFRKKPGESIQQYRGRIIRERIEFITDYASDGKGGFDLSKINDELIANTMREDAHFLTEYLSVNQKGKRISIYDLINPDTNTRYLDIPEQQAAYAQTYKTLQEQGLPPLIK